MYMIFATAGLELALIWATLLNDLSTHVFASLLRWTTLCEAMAMDDVLLENDTGLR